MPDINLFELGGKAVRRTFEAVEDLRDFTAQALADEVLSMTPIPLFFRNIHAPFAKLQQSSIADQAIKSLHQNDLAEATHQLNREIYFDNIMPDLTDKSAHKAAQAGLKAINKHKSADEIEQAIKSAFLDTTIQEINKNLADG
jgi:arginine utilization protein RocB